jgi:hypothetical protein
MTNAGDLEHDTIAEAPGGAVGSPPPPVPPESETALRRRETKEDAGRAGRPWCSVDNEEIWTVIAGDVDE